MKQINIGHKPTIQPIEWKQYKGETVIVKTIIRKGQTHISLEMVLLVKVLILIYSKIQDKHTGVMHYIETSCPITSSA